MIKSGFYIDDGKVPNLNLFSEKIFKNITFNSLEFAPNADILVYYRGVTYSDIFGLVTFLQNWEKSNAGTMYCIVDSPIGLHCLEVCRELKLQRVVVQTAHRPRDAQMERALMSATPPDMFFEIYPENFPPKVDFLGQTLYFHGPQNESADSEDLGESDSTYSSEDSPNTSDEEFINDESEEEQSEEESDEESDESSVNKKQRIGK